MVRNARLEVLAKLRWVARTAGVAAAYFLAGKLALLLAIPPGYASPVWPAAGIALAGILFFGYRVWPGVFVGSILVNASISVDFTGAATTLSSISVPIAIATGAALQAVFGGFFVRRWVRFPSDYDRPGDILKTMLIGGPLACVIAPTIATTALLLAGHVEPGRMPISWGTWWLGDTLGVLVILPFVSAMEAEMRHASRRTRLLVGLPVGVAVVLTVGSYLDVRAREWQAAHDEFDRRAEIMARTLEQAIRSKLDIVLSVSSFFQTSDFDRERFRRFVKPAFERYPDLHGLSWNRVVLNEDLRAIEEAARRSGLLDFRVTEQDASGQLKPVANRSRYVVVYYIEPLEGNEQALGYDLASNPDRALALERARDTGEVTATPPIVLVQEPGEKPGFLFFAPVYRPEPTHDTAESRRDHLHSFVSGVFRAERTVEEALRAFEMEGIDYSILDTVDLDEQYPLYGGPRPADSVTTQLTGFEWSDELLIGGRRWTVSFWPTTVYDGLPQWGTAWGVLTGGLFFTSVLGALLLVIAGRAAITEQANKGLRAEVRERRQAEMAVIASERRFRAVFDASAIGVAIADPAGKLLAVNDYVHKMLGYSENELTGKTMDDITPPWKGEGSEQLAENGNDETGVVARERECLAKDGGKIWSLFRSTGIRDDSGKVQFVLCVIEDTTVRRRIEEELLKVQKLESLGVLAGGIAHDFNNLLTAVGGNVELAMQDLPESGQHLLDNANKALRRASGLTGQLLTYSKGGTPVTRSIDLSTVIEEWTSFALTGSKTKCDVRFAADLWPALVDAGQISQVISNLIINADQAMPTGGTIRVSAGNRDLGDDNGLLLAPGRYITISIEDEGIGIPRQDLPRIFDPYFTRKDGGTGLGLATAYSIIKKHGGGIEVDSEPGTGTTIHVYLPASETPTEEEVSETRQQHSIVGARVLVMDDEELIRSLVVKIINGLGCDVETARDGQEAIESYRLACEAGRPFDAVILDLTVPGGMGGAEAIQRLREISPEVKAIVSSGYSEDPVLSHFDEHGFSGVVVKPYSVDELKHALQSVLDRSLSQAVRAEPPAADVRGGIVG